MMTTLDWALELSSHGYAVIPVINKKPLIAWKRIGLDRRKPTERELTEWFSSGPNIAVITGKFHGLVVVDGDSQEAADYIRLTTGGSPMTVVTSRGQHYWFRHPGFHVKSSRRLDDPPIDLKGDGGVCTAPGSVHSSGVSYMLAEGCDLVSVKSLPIYNPNWFPEPTPHIPERRMQTAAPLEVLERSARYLAKIPGAGSGNRNQQAFRAACSAIRDFGVDLDAGEALLNQWDQEKNDPPLGPREISTIVASALNGNRRQPIGVKVL